jgi:formylglycine-generating enzyme required for sulfatase activity
MKLIPGGTFQMGSSTGNSNELPVHQVTVSPFWMDSTEVTQEDYSLLMGGVNPSIFTGDTRRPVERVSWFDAVLYCNKRSQRDGRDTVYTFTSVSGTPGNGCTGLSGLNCDFTKNGYSIPTEAEWEFACRGGSTTTAYYWGDAFNGAYCWYDGNSSAAPHPVATTTPSALGLYDMSGNVLEWCHDWYGNYGSADQADPTGPGSGSYRVLRGGSWNNLSADLRSAYREYSLPDGRGNNKGFRAVLR